MAEMKSKSRLNDNRVVVVVVVVGIDFSATT